MLRFYSFISLLQAAGLAGLTLALLLLSAPAARATHIVGGEMDLQYVSGDSYQLTLNLYFDNYYGSPNALDQQLTATIFDKATNRAMASLVLPLISDTFVNYTNQACAIGMLSTRRIVYRQAVALPAGTYNAPQGYYAAVERCCRNVMISNIEVPGAAAQTFYLEFPAVVRNGQTFRDSTPQVFPPVSDYACLGEVFSYDFGGRDPDGDSLVYDLVTPLNGHATDAPNNTKPDPLPAPYSLITWKPGLSASNQIPGSPGLTVGARTGRIQVRPTQAGLFVFGVRCQQYRRGQRLGETRRDFQLLVRTCAVNRPPSLVLLPGSSGNVPYRPGRDTLRLVPGGPHCVRLRFTDPDDASQLSLRVRDVDYGGVLPTFTTATAGTVHLAGQPDTLVATLCFPDCTGTNGRVRHLDVLVADNGCALPKQDTVHLAFMATLPPNAPPTLTSNANPTLPLHARVGDVVAFDLTATDPDADPLTFTTSLGLPPGATLTAEPQAGTRRVAHFRWPITCAAVTTPPGQVQPMRFGAGSATSCGEAQVAPELSIPVVVEYANLPPTLVSSLPRDSATAVPLVRVVLGETYTATLQGTDPDRDVLTLSAAGQNFELAAAGMRLSTVASPAGRAAGTFTWRPVCDASTVRGGVPQQLTVVFQLRESTCRPQPQTRTVRFEVVNPDSSSFTPPNIILPTGSNVANRQFSLQQLPADFCDAHFTDIRIFSRWGRQVYQSSDHNFRWGGEGAAGLYYYLLTYSTGRRFKGWVEVVQ